MRKQDVKMTHEDIQRAIRRFLAKGGLIRKLPPAATPRNMLVGAEYGMFERISDHHML